MDINGIRLALEMAPAEFTTRDGGVVLHFEDGVATTLKDNHIDCNCDEFKANGHCEHATACAVLMVNRWHSRDLPELDAAQPPTCATCGAPMKGPWKRNEWGALPTQGGVCTSDACLAPGGRPVRTSARGEFSHCQVDAWLAIDCFQRWIECGSFRAVARALQNIDVSVKHQSVANWVRNVCASLRAIEARYPIQAPILGFDDTELPRHKDFGKCMAVPLQDILTGRWLLIHLHASYKWSNYVQIVRSILEAFPQGALLVTDAHPSYARALRELDNPNSPTVKQLQVNIGANNRDSHGAHFRVTHQIERANGHLKQEYALENVARYRPDNLDLYLEAIRLHHNFLANGWERRYPGLEEVLATYNGGHGERLLLYAGALATGVWPNSAGVGVRPVATKLADFGDSQEDPVAATASG
ncbi:MAG: hypothetical protein ACPHID_08180 [Thermoplasmatota archaeon]